MRRCMLARAARRHSVAPRAGWLPIMLLALLGAGCDLNVTGGPPHLTPSLSLGDGEGAGGEDDHPPAAAARWLLMTAATRTGGKVSVWTVRCASA